MNRPLFAINIFQFSGMIFSFLWPSHANRPHPKMDYSIANWQSEIHIWPVSVCLGHILVLVKLLSAGSPLMEILYCASLTPLPISAAKDHHLPIVRPLPKSQPCIHDLMTIHPSASRLCELRFWFRWPYNFIFCWFCTSAIFTAIFLHLTSLVSTDWLAY